jgi:voltage-gated potassium channel
MAASIVGLGFLWALITAMLVELDLGGLLRRRRIMRRIQELSDHYIICGAGRMGRVVVREFHRAGKPFVVIESDPTRASGLLQEEPGLLFIDGDATREHVLRTAGVERAIGLAACLPNDAENLFLCLTARGLKPSLEIVARAYDEESLNKLHRAGANHVISPAVTGAIRMASTLIRPSVVSFLDAATLGSDMTLRLEEAEITEGSPLVGMTLADARIPQRTGLIVLAMRCCSGDGSPTYNPGPETHLTANDVMIVLGYPDQVQRLRQYVAEGS